MKVIVCVDDGMGMLFNHRRQSQDSALRDRILKLTEGKHLWMNHYSAKQFDLTVTPQINVDDSFLTEAIDGDYVFVETEQLEHYAQWIEEIVLYRWNRKYPSDLKFDLDLTSWKLNSTDEFAGHSHDKITEEVYIHG